jgi:chlorobactene glucosyltransferase
MTALAAGLVWACVAGCVLLLAIRQFAAHRAATLVALEVETTSWQSGGVTIVIPARNEIDNIEACLRSLSAQTGPGGEVSIIVVDDESQDGTAAAVARIAGADPRITLTAAGPLPRGWMGKSHACWTGALRADSKWLCFIDADVRAEPGLLHAAVSAAEQQGLAMLSLAPFQVLGSFWERVIIPAGMMLIACAMDLRKIDDPSAPEISANGQFLLIRRAVYFAAGGHAAVRREVCEDKALAARVKRAGWRFRLMGAEHLARTRMYTGLALLRDGLAKNATEFIGDGFTTVAAGIAGAVVACAALLLPILAILSALHQPSWSAAAGAVLALAGSAVVIGMHCGTLRYCRLPLGYALLFPLAYAATAGLACYSALLRRQGRVTWKGRHYNIEHGASPGRP